MEENIMAILSVVVAALAIVAGTYGRILLVRLDRWSEAKLKENGIAEAAKWQADMKAGLLTGAKAALIEGKSIPDAIRAAIVHTLASNSDAAAGLNPPADILENLAKAAVVDAAAQVFELPGSVIRAVQAEAAK